MRPMSFPLAVLSFVAAGACFLDFSLLQKLEQEAKQYRHLLDKAAMHARDRHSMRAGRQKER